MTPTLKFLLNAPPEEILAAFGAKENRLSWDWWEVWQQAHARAFTVAKAMRLDILQDIRDMVEKAMKEGLTFDQFRAELEPRLKAKGWWGRATVPTPEGGRKVTLGTPWRLKNIYRTNLQSAYMAGRYRAMRENAERRPYWMYVAVMDSRTRPSHAALNGKIFRYDDPFWNTHYPPNGFGCRCRVRALTPEYLQKHGLKAESSKGKLHPREVLLSTKTGELTTVTLYHDPRTGVKMAPDPGWNYNPGEAIWKPDLKRYSKHLVYKYQEDKPGLVHKVPLKKYADLNQLMKTFDKENPGIFKRGFKEIKISSAKAWFMQTNPAEGSIKISRNTWSELDKFSPARDLMKALKKIKKGETLSFNEEYALESLWHEITHNRGNIYWGSHKTYNYYIYETLTQFIARHTYPDFLETLGGKAEHQKAILNSGYGYEYLLKNFRNLIKALDINEIELAKEIKLQYFQENPRTLMNYLTKYLKGKGLQEADLWVQRIVQKSPDEFEELLKQIHQEES